jgi:radical SAM protein with 4Fe4S-binding SPASM domain
MPSAGSFLRLGDGVFIKHLEFPAVYNTVTDDVYEVDPDGFEELSRCDGTLASSASVFPREFLDFCLEERVLVAEPEPRPREVRIGRNEVPSLRYLMVELTDRCNLKCLHCYLGESGGEDIRIETVADVLDEFELMGGLRLVVTGGEPLVYPGFDTVNELVRGRAFRAILVTNGTLIDDGLAARLNFHEVQVSLDGMEEGHDFIRGNGSFRSSLDGIASLRRAGADVSIATMIHSRNLGELDALEELATDIGAVSWTLDVPCEAGRLSANAGRLLPDLELAAEQLERAFGSEQHEPSGDWACGAHLAFLKANGTLAKCGFFDDWSGGLVAGGLREAWLRMPRLRLSDLDCDCEFLSECGGGCRFRARSSSGRTGPDPLKCLQFGVGEHSN